MFDLAQPPLAAIQGFFHEHREACQSASLLLGGPRALRRTRALVTDIAAADRPNRRLRRELTALHALLTLKNVGDLDFDESYYFSEIDPSSPVVDDICRLSDALENALATLPAPGFEAAPALHGQENRQ